MYKTIPVSIEKENLEKFLGIKLSGIQEIYWDNIGKVFVFEVIQEGVI